MGFPSYLLFTLLIVPIFFIPNTSAATLEESTCPIQTLYQFGASKYDTGNQIRILPDGPNIGPAHLPYGETFPGRPTGRWSDGALIIDYTARRLRLPLLDPYLHRNGSFEHGVNFAIGGSTAADYSFYQAKGIRTPISAYLNIQLGWFREHLSTICSTPTECKEKLNKAVFFMGEIGSNDINYALRAGKSFEELKTEIVPFINQAIANGTREVIKAGANRVVVPGNYPMGCFPLFLGTPRNDTTAFDKSGCLIVLNDVVVFQNNDLKATLNSLQKEFPNVLIHYADNYAAFMTLLREGPSFGFHSRTLLRACCGFHPFNPLGPSCGNSTVPVCPRPKNYIHWDGIHLTQHANNRIAKIINDEISLKIKCFK